jgi:hypothetical protein
MLRSPGGKQKVRCPLFFAAGDGQRRASEEDPAAEAEIRIHQRVGQSEREQGVEDGLPAEVLRVQIDQDVANKQAEPADFDGDGFGSQLPGRGSRRRLPA